MLKSLRYNNNAANYFIPLLCIILFICIMTVFEITVYPEVGYKNIGGSDPIIFDREKYENMSKEELYDYLCDKHEGEPIKDIRFELGWRLSWTSSPFHYFVYVFPDGFEMELEEYEDFINGDIDPEDVDVLSVIGNALILDFAIFEYLGFVGTIIRIFIISAMVIIIYLMLPFTG